MNTMLLLFAVAGALAGSIIVWFIAKAKFESKVASCEANLQNEKDIHAESKKNLLEANTAKQKAEVDKAESERMKAIAETNFFNEQVAFKNYKNEKELELQKLQQEITLLREGNEQLRITRAEMEKEKLSTSQRLSEQQQFIEESQKQLREAFGKLSADALRSNNESFVQLAKAKLEEKVTDAKGELEKKQQAIESMVKPLTESLNKMDNKINLLETKREGAYTNIATLLDQMKQSTIQLDKETRSLVSALKTSTSRGRYGEIALRRLVEFAGMLQHCDFSEQMSVHTENGRLRPDLIVKLPENRQVVVDSKVPLNAYLEMFETEDALLQKACMDRHVLALKKHISELGSKAYWDQFEQAPDFVVMFMQIESSFGAALQACPGLIEEALNNRIIIATPTTLITIFRSIAYSWNQMKTIENIDEIRDAAVELYERSATLMEHFDSIGNSLQSTVNHYNKAVGSLENKFLPQGRKIAQLSEAFIKKQLPELGPIEASTRKIVAQAPLQRPDEALKLSESQEIENTDQAEKETAAVKLPLFE